MVLCMFVLINDVIYKREKGKYFHTEKNSCMVVFFMERGVQYFYTG